jgi:protein gp37
MALHRTTIAWTKYTTNPVRARDRTTGKVGHYCEKISPGCTNCYASGLQPARFGLPEFHAASRDRVEVFFDDSKVIDVLKRRKPAMIFWCSMTDLFGDWVPLPWVRRCFEATAATPQHIHQVLTKRPERLRTLAPVLSWPRTLWAGVSVESADYAWRIDVLRQIPAAVRFVSFEPLLGPLPGLDLRGIAWAIIGGESGRKHRAMRLAWAADAAAQCDAAGVRLFVKQDSGLRDGQQGRIPDVLWRRKEWPSP